MNFIEVILFAILYSVEASIEGDIKWPNQLLSTDAKVVITVREDSSMFRRPELQLWRDGVKIHNELFYVSSDLPNRIDLSIGCHLFSRKGEYDVRIIATPGGPAVYEDRIELRHYPKFSFSFGETEISSLTHDVTAHGLFNPRSICHTGNQLVVVRLERLNSTSKGHWLEVENERQHSKFPSEALTVPCQAFDKPGQYRLVTLLEDNHISTSAEINVTQNSIYRIEMNQLESNGNELKLTQCQSGEMFDVQYRSPPCANRHKLKVVSMHHRGHPLPHIKAKIFDIYSDAVSITVPCSSINTMAHGVCVHYLDEFNEVQASKCFGLPNKPTPSIDGKWSPWEDEMRCKAPCSLTMFSTNIIDSKSVDYINGKSEWSFRRRTCSNPNRLGKGAPCHADKLTSNNRVEFNVRQESCENPWQLAQSNIDNVSNIYDNNCECGCSRMGPDGGVIFSPAPWRCNADELVWSFECENCDYLVLDVLYYGISEAEAVYITEQKSKNETFKIDSVGLTQHSTPRAVISYKRHASNVGCGFALKISFNKPLILPTEDPNGVLLTAEESVAANFGIWGILLCTGFLLLLIVASIFNCRNSNKDSEKHNPTEVPNAEFEQYTEIDISNNSPTKVRPTAACFSLAQQQLRLMKAEGRNEAVATYPRELFESEQQAREQIPLLFGGMKRISASSMGSDKVEAAPARSNRTEVTHSTNVSDQSQEGIVPLRRHTIVLSDTDHLLQMPSTVRQFNSTGTNQRPYSMSFADCSASSDPPSPINIKQPPTFADPPPNSRVPSDEDSNPIYC